MNQVVMMAAGIVVLGILIPLPDSAKSQMTTGPSIRFTDQSTRDELVPMDRGMVRPPPDIRAEPLPPHRILWCDRRGCRVLGHVGPDGTVVLWH